MPGLFIQRQAEAITPYCDVAVIYVHPDPECPNKVEAEFSVENEVRVLRVYYKVRDGQTSSIGKALNLWQFYRAYLKAFHSIREFSPDLVHVHILTRMGLIGLKISRKRHIPLIISEHWSRYFPESDAYHGWIRKLLTRCVVKRAAALVVVSEQLKIAMTRRGLANLNFRVIPNIAEMPVLRPSSRHARSGRKTMVHISCFDDRSKNISGFLRSIRNLANQRQDFTCLMVGDGPDLDVLKEYADILEVLGDFVQFTGMKTGDEFTEILDSADFSVLSSLYETFGTVVIESLVCGVPVVATSVGIASGIINDANGLLVPPGDERAMTEALDRMLTRCREYDGDLIRKSISGKFDKETVGLQIVSLYRELLPGSGQLKMNQPPVDV